MARSENVYCCDKVWFGYYYNMYAVFLGLVQNGSGVSAVFDTVALNHLMRHCNREHVSPKEPKDLAGLLFETKWSGDAGVGDTLIAIRIHPSYGKKMPWLKTGLNLLSGEQREDIKRLLTTND